MIWKEFTCLQSCSPCTDIFQNPPLWPPWWLECHPLFWPDRLNGPVFCSWLFPWICTIWNCVRKMDVNFCHCTNFSQCWIQFSQIFYRTFLNKNGIPKMWVYYIVMHLEIQFWIPIRISTLMNQIAKKRVAFVESYKYR